MGARRVRSGTVNSGVLSDGTKHSYPGFNRPSSILVTEAFLIENGKIRRVEMIGPGGLSHELAVGRVERRLTAASAMALSTRDAHRHVRDHRPSRGLAVWARCIAPAIPARPRRRHQGPARRSAAIPSASPASNVKLALLASLNHQNIGTIYGIRRSRPAPGPGARACRRADPRRPLAPARSRSPKRTDCAQWPTPSTPRTRRGIVHRDLKPANIKVPHGRHCQGARLRHRESQRGRRRSSIANATITVTAHATQGVSSARRAT